MSFNFKQIKIKWRH